MTTYSNPRMTAEMDNWPSGGHRVKAEFMIETRGNCQRACRRTINPRTGKWGAWKKTTYANACRIVDGDDGRTYVISRGSFIHVWKSNLQKTHETIWDNDERFAAINALFA